jgi:hypothetical protein
MDLKVGQKVWLKPEGNYARYNKDIIETSVISIGRKYGRLGIENQLNPLFDLEDYYEKNDCTPNYQVYDNIEDAINPMRKSNKLSDIQSLIHSMTYAQLIKLEGYLLAKPFL